MEKIREFISKYRIFCTKCMKIMAIVAFVIFPFVLEKILISTPTVSQFSNETWFSFMASYVGALATIIVMLITFKKSDDENKVIIERQQRQYDIRLDNENLDHIMKVLLLDEYYFYNPHTVCGNIEHYVKDIRFIFYDLLQLRYVRDVNNELFKLLLELLREENEIVNKFQYVENETVNNELYEKWRGIHVEILSKVNDKREQIRIEYNKYQNAMRIKYFE